MSQYSLCVYKNMLRHAKEIFRGDNLILNHLQYAIKDIGLRFHPYLAKVGSEFGNVDDSLSLDVATAIEFLQISTLVIDDIIDSSSMRNGQKSVCSRWGQNHTILLGECLKSASNCILLYKLNLDRHVILEIVKHLESAYFDICKGQINDIDPTWNLRMDEKRYFKLIAKTTGFFIERSLLAGLTLSGISDDSKKKLSLFGRNLGLAYQLRDDILDIVGNQKIIGKPVGIDIKQHKMRLPMIYGLKIASTKEKKELRLAMAQGNVRKPNFKRIVEILINTGAIDMAMKKTSSLCNQAIDSLTEIPACLAKEKLISLAMMVSDFR